jgi:hypothetical protein
MGRSSIAHFLVEGKSSKEETKPCGWSRRKRNNTKRSRR